MSQILRNDSGPAEIDASLLLDLWWALGMDEAPPRSRINPLADRVRAAEREDRDPADDHDLVAAAWDLRGDLPVYVSLLEADALQRMRGWHRLTHGTITVEASDLCEVRNLLDGLTLSLSQACEEEVVALRREGLPELAAKVEAAIAGDRCCGECEWCQFLVLRDRCDEALDASGHHGSSRYQAYVRADRDNRAAAAAAGQENPR